MSIIYSYKKSHELICYNLIINKIAVEDEVRRPTMKYRAAIFDLDGTLFDTIEDLADSTNNVLSRHNYPTHDINAYKYFVGSGIRNLIANALPEDERDNGTVDILYKEMLEEYSVNWNKKTKPYSGIPELLKHLTEKGIRLSVLSNKADAFTKQMVKEFLPDLHFDAVLGERSGIPRKPDPYGVFEIAEVIEVSPDQCLYLGDSGIDMKTAAAAGAYPVGALWGFRKADELVANGAQALISKPMELLDLL